MPWNFRWIYFCFIWTGYIKLIKIKIFFENGKFRSRKFLIPAEFPSFTNLILSSQSYFTHKTQIQARTGFQFNSLIFSLPGSLRYVRSLLYTSYDCKLIKFLNLHWAYSINPNKHVKIKNKTFFLMLLKIKMSSFVYFLMLIKIKISSFLRFYIRTA